MIIGISKYLTVGVILTIFAFLGIILNRSNIIIILISIEMMVLAINYLFIVNSTFLDDFLGQIFVLFFLTIAASESALGLGIVTSYYLVHGSFNSLFNEPIIGKH